MFAQVNQAGIYSKEQHLYNKLFYFFWQINIVVIKDLLGFVYIWHGSLEMTLCASEKMPEACFCKKVSFFLLLGKVATFGYKYVSCPNSL